MRVLTVALFAMFFATSCVSQVTTEMYALKSNAVEDLKCAQSKVTVKEIGRYKAVARGCGMRATYTWNQQFSQWTSPGSEPDVQTADSSN